MSETRRQGDEFLGRRTDAGPRFVSLLEYRGELYGLERDGTVWQAFWSEGDGLEIEGWRPMGTGSVKEEYVDS